MSVPAPLVDAIFLEYGIREIWESLPSLGLANYVYATRDVVLRVATDHPDAIVDARTESVAAPVARAAGILTPRLIAFDDSRSLIDRPFSLWERVHGRTFGAFTLPREAAADVWRAVGRELARLHVRVEQCPDPLNWLDTPGRELDFDLQLRRLVAARSVSDDTAREIALFARELLPYVTSPMRHRFVHNDIHPMNIMCSDDGALKAIIDWGDAGWGDPALDFATIPLDAIHVALEGYESEVPGLLGGAAPARVVWDKLLALMEDVREAPNLPAAIRQLRAFLQSKVG